MTLNRIKALVLLSECVGDEIWPITLCEQKGIPAVWIEELVEAFESGFRSENQTIYYEGKMVNQYHGVSDCDLAHKLAAYLGIDTERATAGALGRIAEVTALKDAIDE